MSKVREIKPQPGPQEEFCRALERAGLPRSAVLSEAEAKLAKMRDAWNRYQRNDLDREEFEGAVAELAEGT